MDALVAEKVMGWIRSEAELKISQGEDRSTGLYASYNLGYRSVLLDASDVNRFFVLGGPQPYNVQDTLPNYSTDIAAAWKVVEKLQSDGWACILDNMKDYLGNWQAHLERDRHVVTAESQSAPHAICLAALKAVGAL